MENGNETPRELQVQLGGHTYTVVPQRHAYLSRRVPQVLNDMQGVELTGINQVTPQLHRMLAVFIPGDPDSGGLMPLHEWMGFASDDAMQRDAYSEADDHSPDVAQIVDAFKAVMRVNRFDLVGVLKDWLGPSFLRGAVQQLVGTKLAQLLEENLQTPSGTDSANSRSTNGRSGSTTGGTEARTVELSAAGPSPESTGQ